MAIRRWRTRPSSKSQILRFLFAHTSAPSSPPPSIFQSRRQSSPSPSRRKPCSSSTISTHFPQPHRQTRRDKTQKKSWPSSRAGTPTIRKSSERVGVDGGTALLKSSPTPPLANACPTDKNGSASITSDWKWSGYGGAEEEDPEVSPNTPRIDKGKARAVPEPEQPQKVLSPTFMIEESDKDDEDGPRFSVRDDIEVPMTSPTNRYVSLLACRFVSELIFWCCIRSKIWVEEEGEVSRKGNGPSRSKRNGRRLCWQGVTTRGRSASAILIYPSLNALTSPAARGYGRAPSPSSAGRTGAWGSYWGPSANRRPRSDTFYLAVATRGCETSSKTIYASFTVVIILALSDLAKTYIIIVERRGGRRCCSESHSVISRDDTVKPRLPLGRDLPPRTTLFDCFTGFRLESFLDIRFARHLHPHLTIPHC
jgi:hypothetical protein